MLETRLASNLYRPLGKESREENVQTRFNGEGQGVRPINNKSVW